MGTSAGRLFCYKNNVWNHVGTLPQGFSVNPAVGDINADGHKEIVAIDSAGNVYAYNRMFVLLQTFPCSNNEVTVGTVTLEDITGDNILDIIYSTNRTASSTQNAGVRVIDYANLATYSHLTIMDILAAPAVGDVDHIPGYEIVVPYSDSYTGFFRFKVLKFESGDLLVSVDRTVSSMVAESALPPIIVDMNEDGVREIAWRVNEPNGDAIVFYYSVPDDQSIYDGRLVNTTGYNNEAAKLIDLTSSVAILSSQMWSNSNPEYVEYYGVRIENGMIDGPGSEWYFTTIPSTSVVKSIVTDQLFSSVNGYYPQQVVLMTDDMISYYNISINQANPNTFNWHEIWDYQTSYGENVHLLSMVTANSGSNRKLYAITDDGKLFGYSFTNSSSNKSEISQHRQTSRHTGCYEQPIPQEIRESIVIKHPFVVDKETTASSSNITIDEGVVGRFEKAKYITLNRSNLIINGSEENPVI